MTSAIELLNMAAKERASGSLFMARHYVILAKATRHAVAAGFA